MICSFSPSNSCHSHFAAKGCAFLHNTSPPVMHRDLKSPNILLADLSPQASVVAKLCDFGVSFSGKITTIRKVDCPVWLAPEVIEQKPYTEKADVYSLGVIFWELLTKESYFGEIRFMAILEDMVKAGKRPPIPSWCVPSYQQLIEACWDQDPDSRPSCKDIVKRLDEITNEICPEIANYDATAETDFFAKRMAQAERRRQKEIPAFTEIKSKRAKSRAMHLTVRKGAGRAHLSESIKMMAVVPNCSKLHIAECMEEFLKLNGNQMNQKPNTAQATHGEIGCQSLPTAPIPRQPPQPPPRIQQQQQQTIQRKQLPPPPPPRKRPPPQQEQRKPAEELAISPEMPKREPGAATSAPISFVRRRVGYKRGPEEGKEKDNGQLSLSPSSPASLLGLQWQRKGRRVQPQREDEEEEEEEKEEKEKEGSEGDEEEEEKERMMETMRGKMSFIHKDITNALSTFERELRG